MQLINSCYQSKVFMFVESRNTQINVQIHQPRSPICRVEQAVENISGT
jgi:hypothetical protein